MFNSGGLVSLPPSVVTRADELEANLGAARKLLDEVGVVAFMFDPSLSELKDTLKAMKAAFNNLMVEVGEVLADPQSGLVDELCAALGIVPTLPWPELKAALQDLVRLRREALRGMAAEEVPVTAD